MDIFRLARKSLPDWARRQLKRTVVEDLYRSKPVKYMRSRLVSTQQKTYQMCDYKIELSIPVDAIDDGDGSSRIDQYEPFLVKQLINELGSDGVFYNVGGGYGVFAQFAEVLGVPPNQVHTFEADPFRIPILKQNVSESVRVNEVYVSDSSKEGQIKLDDYVTDMSCPDVLAIDVEGAEFDVLQGSSEMISQAKPSIYTEIHPELMDNSNPSDIISFGQRHGYDVFAANHRVENAEWKPADVDSLPLDYSTPSPTCLIQFR